MTAIPGTIISGPAKRAAKLIAPSSKAIKPLMRTVA